MLVLYNISVAGVRVVEFGPYEMWYEPELLAEEKVKRNESTTTDQGGMR